MKTFIFLHECRVLRWMKRSALPGLLIAVFVAGVAAAASKPISTRNVHLLGHLDLEGGGMVDVKGDLSKVIMRHQDLKTNESIPVLGRK